VADEGNVLPMKSRLSFTVALVVLTICLVCHVAEIFDQWDHTLQTGDDTEYTLVVLALCAGVAYSLKRFAPPIALQETRSRVPSSQGFLSVVRISILRLFCVLIPAGPPLSPLRI
jgi:hypothetical protein